MMHITVGQNRVECSTIRKKDFDKRFFGIRRQMYKMDPAGLVRMRVYDEHGIEQSS